MTSLQVLICTTLERLEGVRSVLLPPMEGVSYVVSCQGVEGALPSPFGREDVELITMRGYGLSRNRNAALAHSKADLLLLADDDERLCQETLKGIPDDFASHPQWDLLQYRTEGTGKAYPPEYLSSVELAMRRRVAERVRFDERFGIGSKELACGEEEVFVHDARAKGFLMGYVPKTVCRLEGDGTGSRFLTDPKVQRSKGAVLCLCRGKGYAYYRCLREALGWAFRKGANPLPLLRNMLWGVRYVKRCFQRGSAALGKASELALSLACTSVEVSIIVPVLNREKTLPTLFRCLEAVTDEDVELILVDNGSRDSSLSLCLDYAKQSRHPVRVLQEPRRGANPARNLGLSLARGRWAYFFDSDDELTPTFLSLLKPLPEGADMLVFPTVQTLGGKARRRAFVAKASVSSQILSATMNTQGVLWRTAFLKAIGGWNEELQVWQDWELGVRALAHSPSVSFRPRQSFHLLLIGEDGITASTTPEDRLKAMLAVIPLLKTTREKVALHLRARILEGQSRGHAPLPLRVPRLARLEGALLKLYARLGGRGAWRLASLFLTLH
ncbi:MAG: glycosyltransferase family 2 protein [Prevotellaceae bacterium]|nr:glycosyltransferase family 2 protein [Prevotellaceae bacterium]